MKGIWYTPESKTGSTPQRQHFIWFDGDGMNYLLCHPSKSIINQDGNVCDQEELMPEKMNASTACRTCKKMIRL